MSNLASLFAEPVPPDGQPQLAEPRFVDLDPAPGEPSYLVCLSRTLADELIVENRSWLGRTLEVLAQGVLFETDCPLHAGDRIRLEMAIDTRLVEGSGEVLHVQLRSDGIRTALFEFLELPDASRGLLAALAAGR
ncbi:MAG: hypothetical protein OES32_12195 [Acidobacteriota bacterium]|nr:hypothetical protein [Acidobacteriota bacterium]MDH3524335.1 hypothetical protein [Acidobacteriota bacterium]